MTHFRASGGVKCYVRRADDMRCSGGPPICVALPKCAPIPHAVEAFHRPASVRTKPYKNVFPLGRAPGQRKHRAGEPVCCGCAIIMQLRFAVAVFQRSVSRRRNKHLRQIRLLHGRHFCKTPIARMRDHADTVAARKRRLVHTSGRCGCDKTLRARPARRGRAPPHRHSPHSASCLKSRVNLDCATGRAALVHLRRRSQAGSFASRRTRICAISLRSNCSPGCGRFTAKAADGRNSRPARHRIAALIISKYDGYI